MSELRMVLLGSVWLIGGTNEGPILTDPAQVVPMPIPTGQGLSMRWVVLPLPVIGLQLTTGTIFADAAPDETLAKQYRDQLVEVRRRHSPLTLPRRH